MTTKLWICGLVCVALGCGGGANPDDGGVGDAGPPGDASLSDAAVDSTTDAAVSPSACVDNAPPTRPARPELTLRAAGVHLSWAPSSDPSGIREYLVFRDGVWIDQTPTTEFMDISPATPGTTYAYWIRAVDGPGNASPRGLGASIAIPAAEAGLDDGVDEDGDGWLETSYGFRLRAEHPRVAITPEGLVDVVARMSGPTKREPYASWFAEITSGSARTSLESALAYAATSDSRYLDEVVADVARARDGLQGDASFRLLLAVDIVFDDLPPASLQSLRERVNDNPDVFGYATRRFIDEAIADPQARFMNTQHNSGGLRNGLLYAAIFALTDADVAPGVADPFPSVDLLRAAHNSMQPEGWFWRNENHISGDLELHPDRLPSGSPGGMFDNFGYDSAEESNTFWLCNEWATLTGQPRYRGAYHDQYRARFYYALRLPYTESVASSAEAVGSFCGGGIEGASHVRVFTPTARSYPGPNLATRSAMAWRYQDPVMQRYAAEQICSGRWNAWSAMDLLYFDDSLEPVAPSTLFLSRYFAGPGIVASRAAWRPKATLAVLLAGKGYGRRYEDAASFILHRRGPVVVHASKRARGGAHAEASFWFHVRGASSNGLRIYDAAERQCGDVSMPLVPVTDSLGGPIFERGGYATAPGEYVLAGGTACPGEALDPYVTAYAGPEILRYEDATAYTYALADASYAYRGRLERFERAMVHAGEDSVLFFDRVVTTHADARRVWAAHFAPDPVAGGAEAGFGELRYGDASSVRFRGDDEVEVSVLMPANHSLVVRGGTTVISEGPLAAGAVRAEATTIPQPRWLILRGDVAGSVRVQGTDASGAALDEVVSIAQEVRDEVGGFAGNTLASFVTVTRVEAIDGFGALSVVIPHRYDTPDIDGVVHSFEPGRDGAEARPDGREFGRHTLEIEDLDAGQPTTHFFIAISMADPGGTPQSFDVARGEGLAAAVSGDTAWVFTLDRDVDTGRITLPPEVTKVVVFGLGANAQYDVSLGGDLVITPNADGAQCATSAGTLRLDR